jgi:hypothetical protein
MIRYATRLQSLLGHGPFSTVLPPRRPSRAATLARRGRAGGGAHGQHMPTALSPWRLPEMRAVRTDRGGVRALVESRERLQSESQDAENRA